MADMDPELLEAYRAALAEAPASAAATPAVPPASVPVPAAAAPAPIPATGNDSDLVARFLAGASPQTHAAIQGLNAPAAATGDPDQRVRQLLSQKYPAGMSTPEIQRTLSADSKSVANNVGPATTFMSNLANGSSLGWADEAGAATQRLGDMITGTPSTYAGIRNDLRGVRERGSAQHPVVGAAGEFVGGALPMAAAGVPSTLGKAALLGSGLGAVSGAGNSDADPTSAQFAGDVAKGAGIGGIAGGLGYKLTKWIDNAPTRVDDATMRKVVGRAGGSAPKEAEATRENVLGALASHAEVKAKLGSPRELKAAADAAAGVRNAANDAIYDDAASVSHHAAQKAAGIEAERLNGLADDAEHEAEVTAAKLPVIQKAIDRHSANADKYVNEDLSAKAALKASKREVEFADTKSTADAAAQRASELRAQAAQTVSAGDAGGGVDAGEVADSLASIARPGYGQDTAAKTIAKQFDALAAGRQRIPGREVRQWMSDYLAPNTVDPESAMELTKQSARGAARDVLHQHVEDTLGADARAALEDNNRHVNGLSTISQIADTNARKGIYQPLEAAASKKSTLGKVKLAAGDAAAEVAATDAVQGVGGQTLGGGAAGAGAAPLVDVATRDQMQAKAKQRIFGD